MSKQHFNRDLIAFIDASPTPFHATRQLVGLLEAAGFNRLDEAGAWDLAPGGSYYVTRNDSSLIAFRLGRHPVSEDGLRMVGAHTDSPCLRLKPNPVLKQHGYLRFGVEVYGGALLNPWFDRDLSLAGRVTVQRRDGTLENHLVDLARAVAVIPSLAIHLDREANSKRSINPQTMLPPVLGLDDGKGLDLHKLLERELGGALRRGDKVLDFELSMYDTQGAGLVGMESEFITGARLDNLLSCYTAVRSLVGARSSHARLAVCNDHEEVGSGSSAGARGNFLRSVIARIAGDDEGQARAMARSLLVSTDNAHAVHPNFADRHDAAHGPLINAGPVIKVNSNQAYASNSESAAVVRAAAAKARVSVQSFVVRTDLGCGSTIGPLTATALGVTTVDVGVPTFAMHSIRELAGTDDAWSLKRLLDAFYAMADVRAAAAG